MKSEAMELRLNTKQVKSNIGVRHIDFNTQYDTIMKTYPQCSFLLFLEDIADAGSCKQYDRKTIMIIE